MLVNLVQAKAMIERYLIADKVSMVWGSPAVGKSALILEIANEYGLKVIDLRLSQCDPTDLLGFPGVNEQGRGYYRPMDTFPLAGDPIPEGYKGWLLFLDEFTTGVGRGTQAAAYKLVRERLHGQMPLHPKLRIACAGNLETDGAITEPMSTAMQSRLSHVEIDSSPAALAEPWLNWAASNGVDYRVTSYIKFDENALYTFKPNHTHRTYGAPRTWEDVSDVVKPITVLTLDDVPTIAGCVSEGDARPFVAFTQIFGKLPSVAAIEANPQDHPIPQELSVLHALLGTLANKIRHSNAEALMKFISRVDAEFQMVTMKEVVRRDPTIRKHPAIMDWISRFAIDIF